MKKITVFFLLVLMSFPMLTSCSDTERPDVTTPAVVTFFDPMADEADRPLLPEDPRYEGYEFRVLVSGNYRNNDFAASETDTGILEEARYRKNQSVEDTLGISLINRDILQPGTTNGSGPGYAEMKKAYASSAFDYDAGMIGSEDACALAAGGYLTDLKNLPYLDLANFWWDACANRDLCVNNALYATTGAIGLTDNIVTHCILVNKTLLQSRKDLLDPYSLVQENKWTYTVFGSEVKKIREDLNRDGVMDGKDCYGLLTWKDAAVAVLNSSSCRLCEVGEDGRIALTLNSERTILALEQYTDFAFSESCFRYQERSDPSAWDSIRFSVFDEARACYYMTTMNTVPKHREADTDFGILPYPKLTEDQETYGNPVSSYYGQLYCVPHFTENRERTGVISELLAYVSEKLLTPAYYSQVLCGSESGKEESTDMLDLIFSSRVFDIGVYFRIENLEPKLAEMVFSRRIGDFPDFYRQGAPSAEQAVDLLNRRLSEIS